MVLDITFLVVGVMLAVPSTVLFVQCFVAGLPRRTRTLATAPRAPVAVLIPAHDEEVGIRATLDSLYPQLQGDDRVVLVADNCSDGTATVARAWSDEHREIEVLERIDGTRRGKGYALAHGVDHLRARPPEVVVILDADCSVDEGSLDRLARGAGITGRPIQSCYLIEAPSDPSPRQAVSAFAFRVRNAVRPLGLARLGLPCALTGAGMAFPWSIIEGAPLGSGNIVEDLQLGVDLVVAGHPPRHEPDARVRSTFPEGSRAALTQRSRWEHGHLSTLISGVPRLVGRAVRRFDVGALGYALDLAVPPLALHCALLGLAAVSSGAWAVTPSGRPWGFVAVMVAVSLTVAAVGIAWARFARDLPWTCLVAAPFYVLWKIPLYFRFLVRPERRWIRTAREPADRDHGGTSDGDADPGEASHDLVPQKTEGTPPR
ncbi:MAG: glycosyltransferase family 2 protein [Planctomycetes bacterium]|nr:glycosyltransferase family 2 protein [Planctomycetota bacterium]